MIKALTAAPPGAWQLKQNHMRALSGQVRIPQLSVGDCRAVLMQFSHGAMPIFTRRPLSFLPYSDYNVREMLQSLPATVPKITSITPPTPLPIQDSGSHLGDPAQEIEQQPFFASLSARLPSPPSALVTLAMSGLPALTRANWTGLLPMAWGIGCTGVTLALERRVPAACLDASITASSSRSRMELAVREACHYTETFIPVVVTLHPNKARCCPAALQEMFPAKISALEVEIALLIGVVVLAAR